MNICTIADLIMNHVTTLLVNCRFSAFYYCTVVYVVVAYFKRYEHNITENNHELSIITTIARVVPKERSVIIIVPSHSLSHRIKSSQISFLKSKREQCYPFIIFIRLYRIIRRIVSLSYQRMKALQLS